MLQQVVTTTSLTLLAKYSISSVTLSVGLHHEFELVIAYHEFIS